MGVGIIGALAARAVVGGGGVVGAVATKGVARSLG